MNLRQLGRRRIRLKKALVEFLEYLDLDDKTFNKPLELFSEETIKIIEETIKNERKNNIPTN